MCEKIWLTGAGLIFLCLYDQTLRRYKGLVLKSVNLSVGGWEKSCDKNYFNISVTINMKLIVHVHQQV